MQGNPVSILTLNLILSTIVFGVAARIYVLPRIREVAPKTILLPILLLHSMRHLGMMFLSRGAVLPGMPPEFAYPAVIGDLIAAFLAFTAIPAVYSNGPTARSRVWIFNLVGTIDLLQAIALATIYQANDYMGAAYWIPGFWVPSLLVTHYITFVVLRKPGLKPGLV